MRSSAARKLLSHSLRRNRVAGSRFPACDSQKVWNSTAADESPDQNSIDAGSSMRKPISLWPGMYHSPVTNALWEARRNMFETPTGEGDASSRSELTAKTPSRSRTSILYKFSSDFVLREQYRNPWNEIRTGKLVEDLDALAGTISFKHCSSGDGSARSMILVTASVDRIIMKRPIRVDADLSIVGAVTWVGRSSMEMQLQVLQTQDANHPSESVALEANFTFVARDAKTGKSTPINQVTPETEHEKILWKEAEERNKLRKQKRVQGKEEQEKLKDLERLNDLLAEGRVFLDMPALADRNSILIKDTSHENSLICQPQQRNIHGRIFGGFLMRKAFELAFSNAYTFAGVSPRFLEVDRVDFIKPVDVGNFLRFKSRILYTEANCSAEPLINIEVVAHVTSPELRSSEVSNRFYFTFSVRPEAMKDGLKIRNVVPATEEEARRRREEEQQKRDDSRFNQTLKNVQGFLKGRSIPGKVLLTRRPDLTPEPISPTYHRSLSENDAGRNERFDNPVEVEDNNNSSKKQDNTYAGKLRSNSSSGEQLAKQVQNLKIGGRSSDYARVMKFNKVLSETTVILEKLRELAWSGVPHYMRPDVWRLLLGYAPPNSDRREAVLRRKRLEYLESVGQFYDLPDSERSDDEINMLRQIAVDCPRTVPDVSFFQQAQVQKSLERILYTWAIRHPASGYVQGINDLVTPFLVIFLSEYLEGDVESWSMSDLSAAKVSDVEADCYWCLTKLLDGCLVHPFLLFIIWLSSFQDVAATHYKANEHTSKSTTAELANPPGIGVSGPIQVSPSVIPKYTSPPLPWTPPMYPTFPDTYQPKLTGKCTADFQTLSSVIDTAASDCSQPFAALVGNVICCPQFVSLLHIFQGQHDVKSDKLVLPDAVATDCFSDIVSILVSKRANMTIPALCSVTSSNLTGGSCPVQDVTGFEKAVNSSKLLDACRTVDPLKECCRPVCQGAIMEASLIISGHQTTVVGGDKIPLGGSNNVNALNDCKNVVFSYIARKLPADKANTAFRILSSCKVNKACPLEIKEPTEVIKACRNVAAPSPSCCSSLNAYISGIRNQMLITNKQAIVCATVMGSMLRKGGVMTNVYELCDVDLKDFSVQGCLLRSYPADLIFDNTTGYSFTCDLTDNIAAPWPSSSSMSSLSLCAPGFRGGGGGAFGALRLVIILVFMLYGLLPFSCICVLSFADVETSSKDESVLITTVETGNSNEVKVHVEVSGEKTQTVFNTVFEKMVAAAQPIPGFRRVKGGTTSHILEILLEILGYSKVYRQVIKKLINSAIEDYVKQEDLKVGKELSVEQSYEDLEETFEPGESFSFDATIKLQEVS